MEKKYLFALFGLIILSFLSFGTYHLGKFETVDEHFWKYERIPEYWNALREHEWKKTAVNDKPGITVALFAGPGLLFSHPEEHRIRDEEKTLDGDLTLYDASETEGLDIALRLPSLIVNALLLVLIAYLLFAAFGNIWIALFGTLFIGTSPILIGISQILNPDAFLWSMSAAAILSWLAYLKTDKVRYAVIMGLAFGGALLSKYTAHVLIPFLYLLPYLALLLDLIPFARLKKIFSAFLGASILSVVTFSIFLPAVFVKEKLLWKSTLGFWDDMDDLLFLSLIVLGLGALSFVLKPDFVTRIRDRFLPYILRLRFLIVVPFLVLLLVLLSGLGNQSLIPLEAHMLAAKADGALAFPTLSHALPAAFQYLVKILVELYPFVFSLSPLVIFLMLWFLGRSLWNRGESPYGRQKLLIALAFSWFFPVYAAVTLSAGVLMNARYSIMLFPVAFILAAFGAVDLAECLSRLMKRFPASKIATALLVFAFGCGLLSLVLSAPFPFNYTSPLLSRQFVIHDAWGYGQYEAAQKLDQLATGNADPVYVWSDRTGICQFLTKAQCVSGYKIDLDETPVKYMVVSKRGLERVYRPRFSRSGEPVSGIYDSDAVIDRAIWRLDILGRPENFITIIPVTETGR